jgi:hypothetical protein
MEYLHTMVRVTNIDESINFYCNKLGLFEYSRKDYEKDLKLFYKTFTGKDDYKKWNKSRQRKFSDIELKAYHKEDMCKDVNSKWHKTYVGDEDNILFKKFAENIKKMLKNTETNQQELLKILDELFVWIEPPSDLGNDESIKSKLVTINPALNDKKLQDIVVKTRKLIIDIYLQCEKDYQEGLYLFTAIAGEKLLKKTISRNEEAENEMARMITGNHDNLEGIDSITSGGRRKTARKTTRKTTRKNKKSR